MINLGFFLRFFVNQAPGLLAYWSLLICCLNWI